MSADPEQLSGENRFVVRHSAPVLGDAELRALSRVLASGRLAQGPEVAAFEAEMAAFAGRKYGIATSSGTAALHLLLHALGAGENTAVAIPSYACVALMNAVHAQRSTAFLCEIRRDYNLDPASVPGGARIAVVPHLFGAQAEMPDTEIAIEDIAQSIGAKPQHRAIASVTSFYATKLMTTGEGGMAFTDDQGLSEHLRDLRDYDNRDAYRLRFNFKMTEFQAALGRVQLERMPAFLRKRREIAERYQAAFAGLPVRLPDPTEHVFFRYVLATPSRDALKQHLNALGIEAKRPVYKPAHLYFPDRDHAPDNVRLLPAYPGADEAHREALSIPVHPAMVESDVNRVIESVQSCFG